MDASPLTIWCNAWFPEPARLELAARLKGHRLVFPEGLQKSNLAAGGPDPTLESADIALGQPDPAQVMSLDRLRWVHLTSAGFTRYDRDDLRAALSRRSAAMTNSSSVYSEPCAEHIFAMMLAMARQLPQALVEQTGSRNWQTAAHRQRCRLLTGQRVVVFGYGAIASRVVELLAPFKMEVVAVRRRPTGREACRVVSVDEVDALLPRADHVLNILPASSSTDGLFDRWRLGLLQPSALFYNIGRGTTVDQAALAEMLLSKKLAGAYLDVTDPEPLPGDHPLWTAPNCYITPHTAGGHDDEFERLVRHFADNLDRFIRNQPLSDRII